MAIKRALQYDQRKSPFRGINILAACYKKSGDTSLPCFKQNAFLRYCNPPVPRKTDIRGISPPVSPEAYTLLQEPAVFSLYPVRQGGASRKWDPLCYGRRFTFSITEKTTLFNGDRKVQRFFNIKQQEGVMSFAMNLYQMENPNSRKDASNVK